MRQITEIFKQLLFLILVFGGLFINTLSAQGIDTDLPPADPNQSGVTVNVGWPNGGERFYIVDDQCVNYEWCRNWCSDRGMSGVDCSYLISWNAFDPAGDEEDLSIDILYSPDSGQTWTEIIAQNIANNGNNHNQYFWKIPYDNRFISDKARIKIVAKNNFGSVVEDISDADFSIVMEQEGCQGSDVDCGGNCAEKCGDGKTCAVNADCQSGKCEAGICKLNIENDDPVKQIFLNQYQINEENGLDRKKIEVAGTIRNKEIFLTGIGWDPVEGHHLKLLVELRQIDENQGNFLNVKVKESEWVDIGVEALIKFNENDFSVLGAYHWQASLIDDHGNQTPWQQFGGNDTSGADFLIVGNDLSKYYPEKYGYNFANRGVSKNTVEDNTKLRIFNEAFDWRGIPDVVKDGLFDVWVNKSYISWEGNCFGMALSSLMNFVYPDYDNFLETNNKSFLSELAKPDWIPSIPFLPFLEDGSYWKGEPMNPTVEYMMKFQLLAMSRLYKNIQNTFEVSNDSYNPLNVIKQMDFSRHLYVIEILKYGNKTSHAIVGYKSSLQSDGKYKVFVYDNMYPNNLPFFDNCWLEIENKKLTEKCWVLGEIENPFTKYIGDAMYVYEIDKFYNNSFPLKPDTSTADEEAQYYFSGIGNFFLTDNQGRNTGYVNGQYVNEIPYVDMNVSSPVNNISTVDSNYKVETYYVKNGVNVVATITGYTEGSYSLIKIGRNYVSSINDVLIKNGDKHKIELEDNLALIKFNSNITSRSFNVSLKIENDDGVGQEFKTKNLSSNGGLTQKFTIDWNKLLNGEDGSEITIDANGDNVFERTYYSGSTFEMPIEAPNSSAGGSYIGNEGDGIVLDASGSTAGSGQIVKYKWDLDGDGVYEAEAATSTMEYAWKDDFSGKIGLLVTQDSDLYATSTDDILTATSTAEVVIKNVAPTVDAGIDQIAECGNGEVLFSGSFTDPGILDTHTIRWDFGDGTSVEGALAPNHKYLAKGNYTATLTVTDDDGGVGSDTVNITVADTAAPNVVITSPEVKTYLSTAGLLPITYAMNDLCDANPQVKVYLDGAEYTDNKIDLGKYLGETGHALKLIAIDASGNSSEKIVAFNIVPQSLKSFAVKDLKIKWQLPKKKGQNPAFTLSGRFELPDGYKKASMAKSALLSLAFDSVAAKERLNFKETGNNWLYQSSGNLNQGMTIKSAVINWMPDKDHCAGKKPCLTELKGKNWFYVRGELTNGLDINSPVKSAIVSLELPVAVYGQKGSFVGKETERIGKSSPYWRYGSPAKWNYWPANWWNKWDKFDIDGKSGLSGNTVQIGTSAQGGH